MNDILKYKKVELAVRKQIKDGIWKPGTRIPPEKELVTLFGVSLITVKKAINNLVEEGFLENREGRRGAFVCSPEKKSRENGSNLIAVVIDNVQQQFGADILLGIENYLYKNGFHIILCDSGRDPVKVNDFFDGISSTQLAGVILSPVIIRNYRESNLEIIKKVRKMGCPYVLLDRYIKGLSSCYVSSNHQLSARQVTEKLLAEGYKNMLVFTSLFCTSMQDRYYGFRDVLEESGVEIPPERIINLDDNLDYLNNPDLMADLKLRIEVAGDFTAFYAMNTRLLRIGLAALEDLQMIQNRKIRLAVNDSDFPKDLKYAEKILYTEQRSHETGKLAGKLIVELINERTEHTVHYILPDTLIER